MKKQVLLVFILIITIFIIPSFFTKTLAVSNEPYEMQKIVELDKKLDVSYKIIRKYYNSSSEELMADTKSDYGYNDLVNRSNSAGRINLYNQLYTIYSSIYSTNETINPTDIYYVIGEVDLNTIGLTTKEAIDTYYIFRHDNPIFYYSNNSFVYSGTTMYVTIFEDYASGEVRQTYEASIASAIDTIDNETNNLDEYNKILAVHDYLCENMDYVLEGNIYEHNIIGALIEHKGVCEAYARTFELILNYLDIDNVLVTGLGDNGVSSEAHAWNLVKLDNHYYWVDCTWDDQVTTIFYTYFMRGNLSWGDHTPNTPETEDFLYSLPNSIANVNVTYQAIEIFKDGNSIGTFNSAEDIFNAIIDQNDEDAEYELVFDNSESNYLILPGQWPEAENIKITSSPVALPEGGHVSTVIMFYGDVTLNSDLTISGVNLITAPNTYFQSGYSCVDLNIGSHTIYIPDVMTNIGGRLMQEGGTGHVYNRVGLNIIGSDASSIICNAMGDTIIDSDMVVVDEIRGYYFNFNVGEMEVGTLNTYSAQFREDYNATIDNLYIGNLSLETEPPEMYNTTGTRIFNIGNLNKYNENNLPIFKFTSMTDSDIGRWPDINITGNINDNFKIAFWNSWMPSEGFKLLNIGNNSGHALSLVLSNFSVDVTSNFYKDQNGDIVTCYHNGETEIILAHEATCTEDGNTEGVRCLVCGNVISGNEVVPATGHTNEEVVTPATLLEDGKIENVCTECGNRELINTIYRPVTFILSNTPCTYDGEAKRPDVLVIDSDGSVINSSYYDVVYEDKCTNVGTYTASIVFKGNYSGIKTETYTINPRSIGLAEISGLENKIYTGNKITQNITVQDGSTILEEGKDYILGYSENINKGVVTLTITGIGNYKDSYTHDFNIIAKDISMLNISGIENKIYTGKAQTQIQSIVVKDEDKTLKAGTDYTLSYRNNIKVGTATVIVTGKGNYTGSEEFTFNIDVKDITGVKVTGIANKVYTGKAILQSFVVKDGNVVLKKGTDYTVTYKNNKKIGIATIEVTGKGNYIGTITKTFKINPKGTSISKLSSLSKGFTAKWSKQTVQTTGYQIEYATDSKFTKNEKKVTINGNKNTTKKISKLKKNKKYYIRIRTYKTVNGIKYYSSWSKVKMVTTKK